MEANTVCVGVDAFRKTVTSLKQISHQSDTVGY